MRHWLGLRALLYLSALVLAAFGIGNAFVAVFAQARYEVVYRFDVTVSYCTEDLCAFSGMLSVANTGRDTQDLVTVSLAGIPSGLGSRPRFLNLDASLPRAADPVTDQRRSGERLFIRLHKLTPGTLAQFPFRGTVSPGLLQGALEPQVSVQARGRVVEGDPRGIALGRWFSLARGSACVHLRPRPHCPTPQAV